MQTAPSLIAAVAGISGVLLGSRATSVREANRDAKNETIDRAYLSTHLSAALERFVDGCFSVVIDLGTNQYGEPNGADGEYFTSAVAPVFEPLKIDGNWKSLSSGILDRVLLLPYRVECTESTVEAHSSEASAPDFSEAFTARHFFYAKLGLEVVALIDDLRQEAGLSKMERGTKIWSREVRLKETYEKLFANFNY